MDRKTLTITLDLESAAFADGFGDQEVALILKSFAARVEQGLLGGPTSDLMEGATASLRDTNGNTVGQAVVSVTR